MKSTLHGITEVTLWVTLWFFITGILIFVVNIVMHHLGVVNANVDFAVTMLSFPVAGFFLAPLIGKRMRKEQNSKEQKENLRDD